MDHGNEGQHSMIKNARGMSLLHLLVPISHDQIDAAVGEHQFFEVLLLGVLDAVRKTAVET